MAPPRRESKRDFPASKLWADHLDGEPETPLSLRKPLLGHRRGKRRLTPEEALRLAIQQMRDGTLYKEGGNKE